MALVALVTVWALRKGPDTPTSTRPSTSVVSDGSDQVPGTSVSDESSQRSQPNTQEAAGLDQLPPQAPSSTTDQRLAAPGAARSTAETSGIRAAKPTLGSAMGVDQSAPHVPSRQADTRVADKRGDSATTEVGASSTNDAGVTSQDRLADLATRFGITIVWHGQPYPLRIPFQGDVAGRNPTGTELDQYVPILVTELGQYTRDVMRKVGLQRIVLACDLSFSFNACGGLAVPQQGTIYLDVARGLRFERFARVAIHHEIFHLIDHTADGSQLNAGWAKLNPAGFRYLESGLRLPDDPSVLFAEAAPRGFLSKYSTCSVQEDKAEVYARMCVDPAEVGVKSQSDAIVSAKVGLIRNLLGQFCPEIRLMPFDSTGAQQITKVQKEVEADKQGIANQAAGFQEKLLGYVQVPYITNPYTPDVVTSPNMSRILAWGEPATLDGVPLKLSRPYSRFLGEAAFSRFDQSALFTISSDQGSFICREGANGFSEIGPCGNVGQVQFSQDGRTYVYIARETEDKKWVCTHDNKRFGPFRNVTGLGTRPDRPVVLYAAETDGVWRIYENERPIVGPFEDVASLQVASSGRIAIVVKKQAKWFVLIDSREEGPYAHVTSFRFDPTGQRYAYITKPEAQKVEMVVVDGKEVGSYESVSVPNFSPNGNAFAYVTLKSSPHNSERDSEGRIVFLQLSGKISTLFINGRERLSERHSDINAIGMPAHGIHQVCVNDAGTRFVYVNTDGQQHRQVCVPGWTEHWQCQNFVRGGEPRFVNENTVRFVALKRDDRTKGTPIYQVTLIVPDFIDQPGDIASDRTPPNSGLRRNSETGAAPNSWPNFRRQLQSGNNEVRIRNPNGFAVKVGLRSGDAGRDFDVSAGGTLSTKVIPGTYEIYFRYENEPGEVYQGDNVVLTTPGKGVEIQLIRSTEGNYNLRRVGK